MPLRLRFNFPFGAVIGIFQRQEEKHPHKGLSGISLMLFGEEQPVQGLFQNKPVWCLIARSNFARGRLLPSEDGRKMTHIKLQRGSAHPSGSSAGGTKARLLSADEHLPRSV